MNEILAIEELEVKITAAIDEAIVKGYAIVDDTWGFESTFNNVKCCCAIGALAIQKSEEPCMISAITYADMFGNTSNFWAFIAGFLSENSKDRVAAHSQDYFDLGAKFRIKYNPQHIKGSL